MIRLAASLSALLVCYSSLASSPPMSVRSHVYSLAVSHQVTGGFSPTQLATAYDFQPLLDAHIDGSGQTVALVELDRYDASSVALFDEYYKLPAPAVSEVYAGSQQYTPPHEGETDFDVEWLHALAPGAAIRIYYLDPSAAIWQQFSQVFKQAATDGASIISVSIGTCSKSQGYSELKGTLSTLLQHHVSVFAASGDFGDKPGPKRRCGTKLGVTLPAADPSVVAVGGTSLHLNTDNSIRSEVAWPLSGGGPAANLTRFPWQRAPTMSPGTQRWTPDVAFLGDAHTGVNFVTDGKWAEAGGTSLGAPAWAAAWALVQQSVASTGKTIAAAPHILYRIGNSSLYSSDFHDIVKGSNGRYRAGPGWDPVTGWGSPDVAAIAATVKGWAEAP